MVQTKLSIITIYTIVALFICGPTNKGGYQYKDAYFHYSEDKAITVQLKNETDLSIHRNTWYESFFYFFWECGIQVLCTGVLEY